MKRLLMNLVVALGLILVPATAFAADPPPTCDTGSGAKKEVLGGLGQTGTNCDASGVSNAVATAVEVLSIIAGAVAIIMIIYSGLKYITSGGDTSKVASAKNALIYAVVGIAVAVLAQTIVRVVVNESEKAATGCPTGQHKDANGKCIPD